MRLATFERGVVALYWYAMLFSLLFILGASFVYDHGDERYPGWLETLVEYWFHALWTGLGFVLYGFVLKPLTRRLWRRFAPAPDLGDSPGEDPTAVRVVDRAWRRFAAGGEVVPGDRNDDLLIEAPWDGWKVDDAAAALARDQVIDMVKDAPLDTGTTESLETWWRDQVAERLVNKHTPEMLHPKRSEPCQCGGGPVNGHKAWCAIACDFE